MAERFQDKNDDVIPVVTKTTPVVTENKSAFPIWLPILLVVLAIGGLGYAMTHRGQDETAAANPSRTPVESTMRPGAANAVPTSPNATTTTPETTTANTPTSGATTGGTAGTPATTTDPNVAANTPASGPGSEANPATNDPGKVVDDKEVTDIMAFGAAPDRAIFAGRNAKLTNVNVRSVVSNRGFYVGTSDKDQMLVFLDTSVIKKGTELADQVKVGQIVSVMGSLEPVPAQEVMNQQYAFKGKDYEDLKKQSVYLHAMKIQFKAP